ncbi:MAG TPA: sulfotransferase [Candidatus Sulfotelmatobacter sp.]|nr:sulfotransferase [Candidatus Sulfotelmatobacter sp.]
MKAPVFIVGCPRSGTSFLYHLLISAGGFAEFHTQMNVYDVLEPIYGDLGVRRNREAAIGEWLRSKAFRVSGLDAGEIEAKILSDCRGAGDFLRIIMEEIAGRQGVDRWIDSTPTNAPHMLRIQRDFPEAQFVHIIRDPRDVALSLDKRGWSRPLPWDKKNSLLAAGLYWEWIVRKARELGAELGPRYLEVRYESLVEQPRETLAAIGQFLNCELDYERIRHAGVGSVKTPLTAFKEDLEQGRFTPVGRWKDKFPAGQLARLEGLIGAYMVELGYVLSSDGATHAPATKAVYMAYYACKQWAKIHTPLSRMMVDYSAILIDK